MGWWDFSSIVLCLWIFYLPSSHKLLVTAPVYKTYLSSSKIPETAVDIWHVNLMHLSLSLRFFFGWHFNISSFVSKYNDFHLGLACWRNWPNSTIKVSHHLGQGSQTQIQSRAAKPIKDVPRAAHWRKMTIWGPQFLEEGSQGPNMILFLHLYGFISNIFGKKAWKYLLLNKNPYILEECGPRVWDPWFWAWMFPD